MAIHAFVARVYFTWMVGEWLRWNRVFFQHILHLSVNCTGILGGTSYCGLHRLPVDKVSLPTEAALQNGPPLSQSHPLKDIYAPFSTYCYKNSVSSWCQIHSLCRDWWTSPSNGQQKNRTTPKLGGYLQWIPAGQPSYGCCHLLEPSGGSLF